ncbi:2OG-Fe(II) oxygenase [Xanthomonas graminis]|uniref:2OG-Fe(II) oxygenase n=1 Tax=Xanthomonas graminis TaxID=3390026 RepID=UPI001F202EBC|nr:2OG-Fe(II) oxygenase [Xanthomonas translucens]UKE73369.1 2OG-Fe(II) oxygenase [Xanthomonas translucens pv. phleipratensis]
MADIAKVISSDWPSGQLESHPFVWAYAAPGELIDPLAAIELARKFPTELVRRDRSERIDGKQYRNYSIAATQPSVYSALSPIWQRLVGELLAAEFSARMARFLRQAPAKKMEIRLVRHESGDWMGPHTDSAEKLFTLVLYFNEMWREQDGGALELLGDNNFTSVVRRIYPLLGSAVVLVPSDRSWHQVQPVLVSEGRYRQSLVVHGSR